jgi:hypothetical protein
MNFTGSAGAVSAGIEVRVLRANGASEDLGTVGYWHRRWWRRAAHVLGHLGEGGRRRPSWSSLRAALRDTTGATVFTHAGKAIVTDRVKGAGGAEPLNAGWGTAASSPAAGDTALDGEKATDLSATSGTRTAGTSSRVTTSVANDTYRVVATRAATGAGTVTNMGLFDSATIGAGALLMKGDMNVTLAAGDSIQATFNLQLT